MASRDLMHRAADDQPQNLPTPTSYHSGFGELSAENRHFPVNTARVGKVRRFPAHPEPDTAMQGGESLERVLCSSLTTHSALREEHGSCSGWA